MGDIAGQYASGRARAGHLIVVDDEAEIRGMVADYLGRDGYSVCRCASGSELDAVMGSFPADLVVLDVSMPDEDGISIARRLRASGTTPIIMLTALDDVVDRVVGLEVGADDYLTKPFDLRELRARIRAVLRRARGGAAERDSVVNRGRSVDFGRVVLDLEARCLIESDGARTRLTSTEFDLLRTFAESPNRVMSRERLLEETCGQSHDPFDRSIDIRIARIRKKIEVDPAKPQVIRTVRGAGYMFVPPHA